jgi:glycosyltransferase involved in cell wall biosynthesis
VSRTGDILAVTNFWPPMAGGTGYMLRGMIGDLANTVVLTPRQPDLETGGSCRVVPRLRFSGRAGGPLKVYSALQHLEVVLAPLLWCSRPGRRRPGVVVCVQPLFCGVGGLITKWLLGIPFVTLVHGEELTTVQRPRSPFRLRHRLLGLTLRSSAAVICNTEHTRQLAARLYALDPQRLRVIHPAIDPARQGAPALTPEAVALRERLVGSTRMVLTVGRLAQVHKGFDTAIEALPEVLAAVPATTLVIAGPGNPEALAVLARSLGVADRVVFVGQLSPADLGHLFSACDLFLLPGREVDGTAEGFGVVFLEAALAGKPAVAGRSGGVSEAVLDGETGLLVDGREPGAVAAAVIRLLRDGDYAARLGARARQRVLEEFDGRLQRRTFSALVEQILGDRG